MQVGPEQLDFKLDGIYILMEKKDNGNHPLYAFWTYRAAEPYLSDNREIIGPIPIMDVYRLNRPAPNPRFDPIIIEKPPQIPSFDPFSFENKPHAWTPKPIFSLNKDY